MNGLVTLTETGASTFLDSGVLDFILEGAEGIIGLLSIQPMGTFISISIIGGIIGIVASLVHLAKR